MGGGAAATRVLVATATLPALLLGPASAAAPRDASTVVQIGFDSATPGSPITAVRNAGTANTTQSVVTANGGALGAVWSKIGSGPAADFPVYGAKTANKRAVIAVLNAGSTDQLTPGARPFTFGATARLDAASEGTDSDNGNNLVQRGLYDAIAQYKLEADSGYYTCRVKGDGGALAVTSTRRITADVWYRVTCSRQVRTTGDRLVVKVAKVHADGSLAAATTDVSKTAPIGQLSYDLATPLSIGGKLADATTITDSSDQFNGVVDDVVLTLE